MFDSLTSFVTVLLALSIAAERIVELVKGFFPWLNGPRSLRDDERKRELVIHALSLPASVVVVLMAQDYIREALKLSTFGLPQIATFALLASGGSGVWNSILTYLLSAKNLKREKEAESKRADNADLASGLPTKMPSL